MFAAVKTLQTFVGQHVLVAAAKVISILHCRCNEVDSRPNEALARLWWAALLVSINAPCCVHNPAHHRHCSTTRPLCGALPSAQPCLHFVNTFLQPPTAQQDVARQLDKACRDVGFFYVTNHGVPPPVHEGVLQAARQWFKLPTSLKNQIAISPQTAYRGFQALGTNVTRYQGGFQRDWHEAIDLYKEVRCVSQVAGMLQAY